MQLIRRMGSAGVTLGLITACASPCRADLLIGDSTVSTMVRYFTDSDNVSVHSYTADCVVPLRDAASLSLHLNNEHVIIPAVSAPVGSAEAIDAITTASRPISGNAYQDYIKVRNELQGELSRPGAAVTYYLSSESDYLAQQLGARVDRDVTKEQTNLSLGTSYSWDAIEPLADDDTNTAPDHKRTVHVNAVATQALTPATLLRVGVEYNVVNGLQHNPYRNVYAGGTIVPEEHPSHRERRDVFVRLNQFLPNRSTVKLSYRLYNDDWGILSHEIDTRLSQYITHGASARYEYRYYTQNAATFYRDEYTTTNGVNGYRTGDYRMADLSSHLFGVALNFDLDALQVQSPLMRRLGLWVNYERYFNSNNYSANILETGVDFRFD